MAIAIIIIIAALTGFSGLALYSLCRVSADADDVFGSR